MNNQMTLFELQDSNFVSSAQRKIVRENPYFSLFSDKTLGQLGGSDQNDCQTFFNHNRHPLLEAFWTAQTIALEKLYNALDARFLRPYSGSFHIMREDGTVQEICYKFEPDYKPSDKPRTTPPRPRLQFFSDAPSPISNTGYLNHFMECVPFTLVSSMEELIELTVKSIASTGDYKIFFL